MGSAIRQGEHDLERLQQQGVEALQARGWSVDYVEVRNQSDLLPASSMQPGLAQRNLVVLAAARLGKNRLLDNIEIDLVD